MNQNNPPLPSATVLLLRDSPRGLEVFMMVRHHEIDAFSGALVFPGGKVDDGDRAVELAAFCRGSDGLSARLLAFCIAAIREAFEECGVLLARATGDEALLSAQRLHDIENRYRQALVEGGADMLALCRTEGLELAVDRLTHYAHWITPVELPKQFDTHFFLARAPAEQIALHDGKESLDSLWIDPSAMLAEAAAGRRTVVFPTLMNLRRLAESATIDAALAAAADTPLVTVRPRVELHPDGRIMHIPAAAGYGASQVLMSKDGLRLQVLA